MHGTPALSETRLWICRRRRRACRDRAAAPLTPQPLVPDGQPPANPDAQPAVTTGDEVDRLEPERSALWPRPRSWPRLGPRRALGLASSRLGLAPQALGLASPPLALAPPLLAPPLLVMAGH